jgi:hypothetical protein
MIYWQEREDNAGWILYFLICIIKFDIVDWKTKKNYIANRV